MIDEESLDGIYGTAKLKRILGLRTQIVTAKGRSVSCLVLGNQSALQLISGYHNRHQRDRELKSCGKVGGSGEEYRMACV